MRTFVIKTKKSLFILISLVSIIGLLWSCGEDEDPVILGPKITELSPDNGFVGAEVTIIGENFLTTVVGNAVSFNGIEATVEAVTATTITTTVPNGTTSGNVTVTTNGMTSEGVLFTVNIPIIPTITSIDPTSGEIGSTVTITGTNFSTIPSENIVSFNGGIAVVSESTETTITTTVPASASTGNVTVTRDGESNGILFTVTTPVYTLEIPISAAEDDVEEGANNGAVALTSSDLELGEYDTWAAVDGVAQGVQTIGLRYNEITIPPGAIILEAKLIFTCDATGAEPVQLTIFGENVGNAAAYDETAYGVSSRTKTTASEVWDVPEWVNAGDAGPAQTTVDLSSIIQEIINRADWASGNSLNFILEPSGPSIGYTSSSGGREAEAAVDGTAATVLKIIYQE